MVKPDFPEKMFLAHNTITLKVIVFSLTGLKGDVEGLFRI